MPIWLTYDPDDTTNIQTFTVDLYFANMAIGTGFYLQSNNQVIANLNGSSLQTPYSIIVYKCFDPDCLTCTYDPVNLSTGSLLCTACNDGYTLYPPTLICMNCGDGKV